MDRKQAFIRYLNAKKSVDDRALNRRVWARLEETLRDHLGGRTARVLELGAGTGTMVERVLEWGLITQGSLTLVDGEPEHLEHACQKLTGWGQARGFQVCHGPREMVLKQGQQCMEIELSAEDLFVFLDRSSAGVGWDLLMANAFLDLFDLAHLLPRLTCLVRPGGLYYFSINFDGLTIFEPVLDRGLDREILDLYHLTMDERETGGMRSGDSQAGRHLISLAKEAGMQVLDVGSSDWVVYPQDGRYPEDEAYFLHFIVNTVYGALTNRPEMDGEILSRWILQRHAQIERGELTYIAHQLDVVAQRPNPACALPDGQVRG